MVKLEDSLLEEHVRQPPPHLPPNETHLDVARRLI